MVKNISRTPAANKGASNLGDLERAIRKAAGFPEYDKTDPGRPFTPEYDDAETVPVPEVVEETVTEDGTAGDNPGPEDTTPSADAREPYIMPRTETLAEMRKEVGRRHIAEMRSNLEAAQAQQSETEAPQTGHQPTKQAS